MSDAPRAFIDMQKRAIIGIEIEILRLEGKWKLSQNRSEGDRAGVKAGLAAETDPVARTMAGCIGEKQ